MRLLLTLALLAASVCAGPVADIAAAQVTTTVSSCVKPTSAVQQAGNAATKTVRAAPTSFKVFDASSGAYAYAFEEDRTYVQWKSVKATNFGIDNSSNTLQILDYGTTDSNGAFQPDVAGQLNTSLRPRGWDPTVRHFTVDTAAEADPVRCHIALADDGSCPLICHDHDPESWSCNPYKNEEDWVIITGPLASMNCKSATIYAVSK